MWIESSQPLRVRRLVDVVSLRPGLPVEFDEAEGQRLLQRAPGKVKVVAPTDPPLFTVGSPVMVQSGRPWCALVAFMLLQPTQGTMKTGWWYCVEADVRWSFVHESLLDRQAVHHLKVSQ